MNKEQVKARIAALCQLLQEKKIDAYLIPTGDNHQSEYVGEHFKGREFLSGFTGSAGTLLVWANEEAGLWTDGRYFLQAEEQLKDTGITLYKIGEDTPTIGQLLSERMPKGGCLGFDGQVVSYQWGADLKEILAEKQVKFAVTEDLVQQIWQNRPPLSKAPIWMLSEEFCGQSREEKLTMVRAALKEKQADTLILTSLDDIAWLLNLRGGDVAYNPVFLSFLTVSQTECVLYSFLQNETIKEALRADGISFAAYEAIYEAASQKKGKIWLDPKRVNWALGEAISKEAEILWAQNPTLLPKAVKNPVEVRNERIAHVKDGVAVTKFIYWLKNIGKETKAGAVYVEKGGVVSEITAAEKLEEFRRQQPNYKGQSFEPIAAYKEHGAIVHYSATEKSNVPLKKESFLLLDTGGQYLEGTTDITRTIAMGPLTKEEKKCYTLVLKGNLKLLHAVFQKGCRGANLDILAREPLWKAGLDYNHGTGHGVGFLLNVHESPNNFRYKIPENQGDFESAVLKEGMITSDEPGVYLAGKFGIRLENLIVCVRDKVSEFGEFLKFEPLTLVPFDLEAIELGLLTREEKEWLNDYHKQVYETLSHFLTEAEKSWLRQATAQV